MNPLTMLPELPEVLGYVFTDPIRLFQALTHSSYVYENNLSITDCNERLEFLGDAVLELLTSDILYNRYPELTEGELSKVRAGIVCEPNLASHARRIGLGTHIRMGRGESASGGADKDSILSDALEAVIGAMYLDGGLNSAYAFVEGLFFDHLVNDNLINQPSNQFSASDPKSCLQEEIQKTSRVPLVYDIINESGPPHQKQFTATVSHDGYILGTGTGKSKKEAERNAASKALEIVCGTP